jgi:hypothetical protein
MGLGTALSTALGYHQPFPGFHPAALPAADAERNRNLTVKGWQGTPHQQQDEHVCLGIPTRCQPRLPLSSTTFGCASTASTASQYCLLHVQLCARRDRLLQVAAG